MLPKQTSFLTLVLGLLVAVFLGLSGFSASQAMFAKARAQATALEDFRKWRSAYERLIPMQAQWTKGFHSAVEAKDLLALHGMIGSALSTNVDKMLVDGNISRPQVDGIELGLSRACLSTISEKGLVFEADSFSTLVSELKRLSVRTDIELGKVNLTEMKSKPVAIVEGFCLLLKD